MDQNKQTYNSSVILGLGVCLPERIVKNSELENYMDTSDKWIRERTGIQERRIVAEGISTSDLGYNAAVEAIEAANMGPQDIDLIVAATLSPDYYFPGIGVLIQNKLGKHIPAIDLRAQCSGFSWSLTTADALLKTGAYKRALVVGAEIHSRLTEFSNRGRNVSVIFGDGAGAAVLEAQEAEQIASVDNSIPGIIDNYMNSDGSGADLLCIKRPGMSGPKDFISEQEASEKVYLPHMEGRQVFRHAVSCMFAAVQKILKRNNITTKSIDLLVAHQANLRIAKALQEKLSLKDTQVFNNIQKYGNTTAASIPICLYEAHKIGRLKKGALVLIVSFGSGFTWGANLIRWA
jgi:3-oxoacyl-[acyl-carrier-protein] synthase III